MTEKTVRVKVWDGWVRLFHWGLAGCLVFSYAAAKFGAWDLHYLSGYAVLTLVLFRIAWGLVGSENARFLHFLASPLAALRHLADFRRGGPDTETTHNAAGAWMVVALLVLVAAQSTSGLFTNHDVGFTYSQHGPLANAVSEATSERMSSLHVTLIDVLLVAVLLHVAAVLAYRLVKGHDLVRAMITGTKDMPESQARAPKHGHPVLAVALLGAAAAAVWAVTRLG